MVALTKARWFTLAFGALVLAAAIAAAIHFDLRSIDADALGEQVRESGPLGPILLVLLLALQSVVAPIPSQPMLMAAGYVYGPVVGFAIGWFGVLAGASVCFWLARALGRPFVERVVRPERLDAVDGYVNGRGLTSVFFIIVSMRLFAQIAFDAVSYSCGLIRISFPWFVLATAIGEVPKVYLLVYLGAGLGEQRGSFVWLMAAGAAGTFVMFLWLFRRTDPIAD